MLDLLFGFWISNITAIAYTFSTIVRVFFQFLQKQALNVKKHLGLSEKRYLCHRHKIA